MSDFLLNSDGRVLVTGAGGFIGRRAVASLLERGFTNVACLARPAPAPLQPNDFAGPDEACAVEVLQGNLLSREDCLRVSRGAQVVLHLAAGRGEKSYPDAFLNSVVTTRNLLEACLHHRCLKRFVNVSSFAVYSNRDKPRGRLLDEESPMEQHPELRGQAYCFAKVRQDEIVMEYGRKQSVAYVILRPGVVYGPGNEQIHPRVGLGHFGLFLHLGGLNRVPLTYVDNCADAIVLAGLVKGIDGEIFNIVDDDLPSSRRFLRLYKKEVKRFRSIYVPHFLSYLLCLAWEKYAGWSQGQLPPVFGRGTWHTNWKKTAYTNAKLKQRLGWKQQIPTSEGLRRHFAACRAKESCA
jgi:nucleoside-diphosphate-sugar epimerase